MFIYSIYIKFIILFMRDFSNMNKTVLILHGLVGHPNERKWVVSRLALCWYTVLVPNIHELPTPWNPWRKTKDNIINALKDYITGNIPTWKIVLMGNSMGTHLAECLTEDDAILVRMSHYISICWCGLWVEHGNTEFEDFMKLIVWDKSWFFALANGMRELMNTNDVQSLARLKYKSNKIMSILLRAFSILWLQKTITQLLRNKILQFWISKTIWIPQKNIDKEFIKRTISIMGSVGTDNEWEVNPDIATIALWLPKEGKWKQKDVAFNQTTDRLWKIRNAWVQSMVVWWANDPMVSLKNIDEMARLVWKTPHIYQQWWHAPHLSPDAEKFMGDVIDFLEKTANW